jgi:hypothetical protein
MHTSMSSGWSIAVEEGARSALGSRGCTMTCPRCGVSPVERLEDTEWLTLYCCVTCRWRFGKSRQPSHSRQA